MQHCKKKKCIKNIVDFLQFFIMLSTLFEIFPIICSKEIKFYSSENIYERIIPILVFSSFASESKENP